ncbi:MULTISPECIES: DUF4262 domain-containing protein [unclassified Crossiella]|uniref:DUF4262 domain-containing protein n=1 Tax=unclassified Crossiella TaxID=2620835 RepID=UPI001FFFAAFD|nr:MULTISPECIES: DUF4262 domain-containing protein [unclassified Crossiella]MCK2244883.1 DUF4262 domain-containing protein [Crossiella sp. S99.2]MCK2258564.1 DUF4262 domain-containing protein [Crossiella sp. S99.1]
MPRTTECACLICEPPDARQDQRWSREIGTVRRHRWGVVGIVDEPGWAFSYGLWHSFRQPEIAMFGLRGPDMMTWLNELADRIPGGGILQDGAELTDVLADQPVRLRAADASWNDGLFGTAVGFYRQQTPPFLQVIWPDRHGHWPWHPEAGDRCRDWQPNLWLPLAEHPGELWPRIATEV